MLDAYTTAPGDLHRPDGDALTQAEDRLERVVAQFLARTQALGTRSADDGSWRRVASYLRPLLQRLRLGEITELLGLEALRDAAQAVSARGDRATAAQLLARCRQRAQAASLPDEARWLQASLDEECAARLALDAGSHEEACQRLTRAIDASMALLAHRAWPMHGRLLQLACRLAGAERQAGHPERAWALALDLSAFSAGRTARWPLRGIACPPVPVRLDPHERLACGEALVGELLSADRDPLLAALRSGELDGLAAPWLADWACAQQDLRRGDVPAFLAQAARTICGDALVLAPLRQAWRRNLRLCCQAQGRADLAARLSD